MLDSLQVTLRKVGKVTHPSQTPSLRKLLSFGKHLPVCWGHSRGTAVFLMCKVTAAHSSAGMELFACCSVQGKTLGTGLFIPTLGKTKGGLKMNKTLMGLSQSHYPQSPGCRSHTRRAC